MQNDDFKRLIHSDPQAALMMLESLLDAEMQKPDAERDFDRIAALTAAISSAYLSESESFQWSISSYNLRLNTIASIIN